MDKQNTKPSSSRPSYSGKKQKVCGNSGENIYFARGSAEKLRASGDNSFDVHCDPSSTYCIIQFALIFSTLQTLLKCKRCNQDVVFVKYGQRVGLGFKLCVKCSCGDRYINSCPVINTGIYEVNRRLAFAMRLIGVGIHGIKTFCGLMDMGEGFNSPMYCGIVESIHVAVKAVFNIVTTKAAREEKTLNSQAGYPANELSVSGDSSWSKRGFTSLSGIVYLTGKYSNKILDFVVKSSICKACEFWKGKENTVDYEAWFADHETYCKTNHDDSARKMEVDGVVEMFEKSESNHNVKYAYYIGDGDTETFKSLLNVSPYGDEFKVKKKECVLHAEKRMFRRAKETTELAQLKKAIKQVESSSSKASTGSQKTAPKTAQLTNKLIKDLSTCYGLAIRRNPDSIENMRNAIWATYYHKISTDADPQHSRCPEGADSWCEWRKHEAAGLLNPYEHPPALDEEIQQILKPIYEELSSDDLLERCTGANTRNNNESFNSCVWNLAPKHIFCGKLILENATCIAACIFNEGFAPILKIMEVMGFVIGPHALQFAEAQDEERLRNSEASIEAKTARRKVRSSRQDLLEEAEGLLYGVGIAD